MADSTHPSIYAIKFGTDIMFQAQQGKSVLLPAVYVKQNIVGKSFTQPRIGKWSMAAKGARGQKNAQNDVVLSNRFITLETKEDSRVWTAEDEWKTLADIKSPAFEAASSSLGRQIDASIIEALGGTAYAGESGGTSVALPSTQKIAAASANLTVAKIQAAAKILDNNDVDSMDRYLVISPSGLHALLTDTKASSADYLNVKSLVAGDLDTFYGFKIIKSTQLPLASTTRRCYAFQKKAICLGMSAAPIVKFDELVDQSYDKQIYYALSLKAGRLEEEGVVEIACIES